MVEFAFVFPIFLGVLIGLVAFALLFYSYVTLQLAVREGTSAIVHDPSHQTVSSIQSLVRSRSFSLNTDPTQLQVLVEPAANQWLSGVAVSVAATYFVPLPAVNIPVSGGGIIRFGTIQIRAMSVMTIE